MQVCWLILLVSVFACPLLTKSEIKPVLLNKFELAHAAFSTLLRTWTLNSTSWDLVISCYNSIPKTTDYVYRVSDIQWQLTTNITPTVLTDEITRPNRAIPADQLVEYSIIIPSGFRDLGKSNGNLYYMGKQGPIALVPDDGTNWFYHDADFKDMDGDGHIDIVAGRGYAPSKNKPTTQLIWLKNPGNSTITGPWNLTYLMSNGGPDIQLQFARVGSEQVLFGNSYFQHLLQMYWSNSILWNNNSQLHVRHIDYEPFQYAYIQLTMDLNGDQIPDLLVTVNNEFNGSLIAYELPPPSQIRNGTFKKHVIASGFKPTIRGMLDTGSPGQAEAIQFYSLTVRKKPIIILSGDDDGCVYLLEAIHDDDPLDWQYSTKIIHQSVKSTIGQISIEDIDSDGHPELFVPAYNEGIVYIYRLMDI